MGDGQWRDVARLLMSAGFVLYVGHSHADTVPPIETAPLPPLASPDGAALPQGSLAAPTPEAPLPVTLETQSQPATVLKSLAPPVSEVVLPDTLEFVPRPAVIVHGQADWETAFDKIRAAIDRARDAAQRVGLRVDGYPLTVFVETSDTNFTFDMILPVSSAPAERPADFPSDIQIGTTPAGKAMRFSHLASYDEIDGAYEQITAYLDAKDIVVKDAFIEEYLVLGETSASPTTEINIFVQPTK